MNSNHTITARSIRRDLEKRGKVAPRTARTFHRDFHPTKGWRHRRRDTAKAPAGFAASVAFLVKKMLPRRRVST